MKQTVTSNRLNQAEIDRLNEQVVKNDFGGIDLDSTLAATGCELVGAGLVGNNGETHIESDWDKIREASCYLVKHSSGAYLNLWVNAESGENGFDDQVELHFD